MPTLNIHPLPAVTQAEVHAPALFDDTRLPNDYQICKALTGSMMVALHF